MQSSTAQRVLHKSLILNFASNLKSSRFTNKLCEMIGKWAEVIKYSKER
jgi:hypothetical protein